jgi:hypothetical protein
MQDLILYSCDFDSLEAEIKSEETTTNNNNLFGNNQGVRSS